MTRWSMLWLIGVTPWLSLPGAQAQIVISQVYGGGGNEGSTFRNDFIELFNRGQETVSLAGWSVQYEPASGSGPWASTSLSGSLTAGRHLLIQQYRGQRGTQDLPTPDISDNVNLNAASGKVALSRSAVPLTGSCPGAFEDLVGYGSADCAEGRSAPELSNKTAAIRRSGGCADTNDNSADLGVGAPNPRNSASEAKPCPVEPSSGQIRRRLRAAPD
jgi:predicted extracellular nuclease